MIQQNAAFVFLAICILCTTQIIVLLTKTKSLWKVDTF